jgi:hypothetical protein
MVEHQRPAVRNRVSIEVRVSSSCIRHASRSGFRRVQIAGRVERHTFPTRRLGVSVS